MGTYLLEENRRNIVHFKKLSLITVVGIGVRLSTKNLLHTRMKKLDRT